MQLSITGPANCPLFALVDQRAQPAEVPGVHRLAPLLLFSFALSVFLAVAKDFVVIKGGVLRPGLRLDDFAMLAR